MGDVLLKGMYSKIRFYAQCRVHLWTKSDGTMDVFESYELASRKWIGRKLMMGDVFEKSLMPRIPVNYEPMLTKVDSLEPSNG